ncbi:MAG: CapA family protein [Polyangiaceae bacterium]
MRVALLVALLLSACDSPHHTSAVLVGDVLLASEPGERIRAGQDPFRGVAAQLANADVTVANLECSVARSGSPVDKEYTFRAEASALEILRQHVRAVSLANNHSGDYGRGALLETMTHLERAGVRYFGAGPNLRAAHEPLLLDSHGVKLALLGYDEYQPRWFEANVNAPGVAWSEDEQVVSDIARARLNADVVVPFLHWGWETEDEPSARQRALARKMIDAGAAAVVGAHPHRTQGVEYYRDRPIIYSLGNFVFDLCESDAERLGWLLRLELDRCGVARWSTLLVRIDAEGTPWPDPSALTPCGRRERGRVEACKNGALP